jgi:glycosyltransferase involved in cell wall biosynthesis
MSAVTPEPLHRLLLVCEPGKDGAFDHVASLFAHLRERHPEVTVDLAFSSRRSRPSLWQLVESVRARNGEAIDLEISNAPQGADLRACGRILKLVRQRRHQIVHAHSSKAGGLCRLLRAVWPPFPPVIYTPHAYFGLGRQNAASAFVFNSIEKILGRIGTTIAVSYDERTFGVVDLGLSPRRVVLINNGIDVARFRPVGRNESGSFRLELGIPLEAKLFVSVGRDSFQKNYRPLYRAMERVLGETASGAFFVHAGAGAEALGRTLSAEAQRRFRGFDHLDGIERLLGAANAFVLVSRYETLCLSALQALASGLKILLTRAPGNVCLERVGFREISWIPLSEEIETMALSIEDSIRAWLKTPTPPSEHQVSVARRNIASRIQLEKVHRLYGALLRKNSR